MPARLKKNLEISSPVQQKATAAVALLNGFLSSMGWNHPGAGEILLGKDGQRRLERRILEKGLRHSN